MYPSSHLSHGIVPHHDQLLLMRLALILSRLLLTAPTLGALGKLCSACPPGLHDIAVLTEKGVLPHFNECTIRLRR